MQVHASEERETCRFRETSEVVETFHNFSEKEWKDLNKRLTIFYLYRCKYDPRWRRFNGGDLIIEAVSDLCLGQRRWPVGVSLVKCIQGVMQSKVSHSLEAESKHQLFEDTPQDSFPKKENSSIRVQLRVELLDIVGDDDDDLLLRRMVRLYVQDMESKRRDMRALMPDVPAREVFNAWRRLNKLIRKLEKEQDDV